MTDSTPSAAFTRPRLSRPLSRPASGLALAILVSIVMIGLPLGRSIAERGRGEPNPYEGSLWTDRVVRGCEHYVRRFAGLGPAARFPSSHEVRVVHLGNGRYRVAGSVWAAGSGLATPYACVLEVGRLGGVRPSQPDAGLILEVLRIGSTRAFFPASPRDG